MCFVALSLASVSTQANPEALVCRNYFDRAMSENGIGNLWRPTHNLEDLDVSMKASGKVNGNQVIITMTKATAAKGRPVEVIEVTRTPLKFDAKKSKVVRQTIQLSPSRPTCSVDFIISDQEVFDSEKCKTSKHKICSLYRFTNLNPKPLPNQIIQDRDSSTTVRGN